MEEEKTMAEEDSGAAGEEVTVAEIRDTTGGVILCSDHRGRIWKRAKTHVISPDEMFTKLEWIGAPVELGNPIHLPWGYGFITKEKIPNMLRKFPNITRFWILGHRCGYYEFIQQKANIDVDVMKDDIIFGAHIVKELFPQLDVKAFFANEDDDKFEVLE